MYIYIIRSKTVPSFIKLPRFGVFLYLDFKTWRLEMSNYITPYYNHKHTYTYIYCIYTIYKFVYNTPDANLRVRGCRSMVSAPS